MLAACSSSTFSVATNLSPDSESESSVSSTDAGDASTLIDAISSVCDIYSCKMGCSCEEGTKCGVGGALTCGSPNCTFFGIDAQSYNCPTEQQAVYKCTHYFADANIPDRLPRCQFRSGSTAEGDFTYWCCPTN